MILLTTIFGLFVTLLIVSFVVSSIVIAVLIAGVVCLLTAKGLDKLSNWLKEVMHNED